jgi:hypothetical protein
MTSELAGLTGMFREIGLLSHLDEATIQASLQAAEQDNIDPGGLIYRFSDVTLWFDCEFWFDSTVAAFYVDLVKQFSANSRGHFQPTQVQVTPDELDYEFEDDEQLLMSFTWRGKTYTQPLTFMGDWVDLGFVDTFNRVLHESGDPGAYYWINTNDQCALTSVRRKDGQRNGESTLVR